MIDPVDLTRALVSTPSLSGQEDAAVDLLAAVFRSLGWTPERRGRNLYAFLGEGPRTLLLNSHTDTVPVGIGWSRDPYKADVEDGKIYGRGSNDAKGCLASMVVGAARAYASNPPQGRLCLAATCEEETTGKGLEALLPELPKPDAAVVGEPTGLQPAVAQKGLLLLTVTAKGRSAHAAWGGGENAVHAAAEDILALSKLSFDRSHPALGLPSVQVTQVHGGERHNVIPDVCSITVDIRTTPAYAPEELVALVKARVKSEVSVRSQRLVSVATDPSEPIVAAALAANPEAKPFGSPTVSDWVFLKDIPTVKVGPGDSRRSHTPDEFVGVDEVRQGASFYEALVRDFFKR
ncbi:MAG: M20/M25/M40 family metallo-hydrolase [Elusimicrobia bacterium]|nr:M20/M25/M40 family metallo-hydrolase [Elusimicrobiota bacterium]